MFSRRRFLHTGLAAGAIALATTPRAADRALAQAMDDSVPQASATTRPPSPWVWQAVTRSPGP